MIRTYTELIQIVSYEDRFKYLKLNGSVGIDTFGHDRYLNQKFYASREWQSIRDKVIVRDLGCDLGLVGNEIFGKIIIHHMNPICVDDIVNYTDFLCNPEYLICVSNDTHQALHYGDDAYLKTRVIEVRKPNDTCPWRK